uniref:MHC class I-like antigen recognition-like domain-containing protein n=1 Tax=Sinocyclocheilus anshuiensis TaxID=1608454 RepID=A0A671PA18_9TELE
LGALCLHVLLKLHTFTTLYTEINGQTIAGIPEISSVTTLDGRQIDYYDSEIKKLIPRQDWMKEGFYLTRCEEKQIHHIYRECP